MSPAYIFNSPRNQAPFLHFYLLTLCFSESVSWYSSPSFFSLQVTGSGPRRCHAHRRFPATPRSRAKRHSRPCPGPAATASATAPASSNDTQRDAETRETVSGPAWGPSRPLPRGGPIAGNIEMGWVYPRSQWKVKNWSSASLIPWLSPLFIEFLAGESMFYKNRIQIV